MRTLPQRKAITKTLPCKLKFKLLGSFFFIKFFDSKFHEDPFRCLSVTCRPDEGDCSEFFTGTRLCLKTAFRDKKKLLRDRRHLVFHRYTKIKTHWCRLPTRNLDVFKFHYSDNHVGKDSSAIRQGMKHVWGEQHSVYRVLVGGN